MRGFAYLHNATDASVRPLVDVDAPTGAYAAVYTNDRREQLISDLRKHFADEGAHPRPRYCCRKWAYATRLCSTP